MEIDFDVAHHMTGFHTELIDIMIPAQMSLSTIHNS